MAQSAPLQFLPLPTSISPSFWHRLTSLKLHHLGLDDKPVPIKGCYSLGKTVPDKLTGDSVGISGSLELDEGSFDLDVGDGCALSLPYRSRSRRMGRCRANGGPDHADGRPRAALIAAIVVSSLVRSRLARIGSRPLRAGEPR